MSVQPITPQRIREIKRSAKQLSRQNKALSYMQCLDVVCRDQMGLRHFHEAQKLAKKHRSLPQSTNNTASPWILYLQACQDAYCEI